MSLLLGTGTGVRARVVASFSYRASQVDLVSSTTRAPRANIAYISACTSSVFSTNSYQVNNYHRSSARMSSSALPVDEMEEIDLEEIVDLEEIDPGVVEGTDLRVLKYPHPALRAPNAEVTKEDIESGEIVKIAKEMLLVMYAAGGVGLAAPQVGVNKRLMVYNPTGDSKKWLDETILINPKIIDFGEAKDVEIEGCLSFPDMNGDVERSKVIKVEAMSTKGKKMKKKFRGWEARIFQHEYDHLDGTVYIDRLTEEGRESVQPRLNELVEDFGEGGLL